MSTTGGDTNNTGYRRREDAAYEDVTATGEVNSGALTDDAPANLEAAPAIPSDETTAEGTATRTEAATGTHLDADPLADAGPETSAREETGTPADEQTGTATGADPSAEAGPESPAAAETGTPAEAGPETATEAKTGTHLEAELPAEAGPEAPAEEKTGTHLGAEHSAEAGSETSAEAKTGTRAEAERLGESGREAPAAAEARTSAEAELPAEAGPEALAEAELPGESGREISAEAEARTPADAETAGLLAPTDEGTGSPAEAETGAGAFPERETRAASETPAEPETPAEAETTTPADPQIEAPAAAETAPAEIEDERPETPRRRDGEPELPADIEFSQLDSDARRELKSLSKSVAELVGKHLVAAGILLDEDPELALAHARFARTRASRVAVVREAAGIAAYHAGEWAEALGEFRAVRRMTGSQNHLPVMVDCERALGRPERALELAADAKDLPPEIAVELKIVAAGARRDLGQVDAAVVALQGPDLDAERRDPWSARLFYAYADNLEAAGRTDDAIRWFLNAAEADLDDETDAAERATALSAS